MASALPVWFCLNREVQEGLRLSLPKKWTVPDCEWTEWLDHRTHKAIDFFKGVNTDKFMRQPRSR